MICIHNEGKIILKKCSSCIHYFNIGAYSFRALCDWHDCGVASDSSPKLLNCRYFKSKKYTRLDRLKNKIVDLGE